ncbi:MAG: FAD-dependent oxidoreductase [Sporomusaceae bacterium]|nr:FAD-dependent oxidoreductase [Sporomusaceae bacterium]
MAERGYSTALPASLDQVACRNCDVVVIGSGIAGMTVALALDPRLNVVLISKEPFTDSSTYKAQGGIAVAIGQDDSADAHSRDTLQAGQGACREEAVGILTGEGPAALAFLQALGADFCRRGPALALAREAAHSCNRVVHYYDYTGRHIAETLSASIGRRHNITRLERAFLVDLVTVQGECCGCIIAYDGSLVYLQAAAVVVAAGGYSGLFGRSTNAASNSGDGIAVPTGPAPSSAIWSLSSFIQPPPCCRTGYFC